MALPFSGRRPPVASGLVAVAVAVTVAMAGTPASAAPDEGQIRRAGGDTAVAGSYIVVFKDSKVARSSVGQAARDLATRHGGSVARTYQTALRGFEAKVSEKEAARIAADPDVAYVEQTHTVRIQDTQTNPPSWGLDRIDQRNLPLSSSYTYPSTATNVHAYIIDTGIRLSHNDFGGRATSGFDAVDGGSADDCNGHGTHVAGTVGGSSYGVAKGVQLVAVRVLNCSGNGTTAGVAAGIDWVTANAIKPAVANMSLGGGADSTLDAAVRNSIASGVTYGIAAGNGNALGVRQNACNFSPARVTEAITVGATQSNDAAASFSNFGTCVDILAPGVSITSAWYTSNTATNTISGTSMATPHLVGVAALVLAAQPARTPAQVRDDLVSAATSGVISNPGTGTPNLLLFVGDAGPPPANDFSISVNPTSGSVTAGGSVTAAVSTATTAGSAQTVSLGASGLPSGATATFSPTSVTSGGASTLTISTSASTPSGTYPVTVTGTGSSASHGTTYSLTVTGGSGGTCGGTNPADVSIPDQGSAVFSDIAVSGCPRAPSTSSAVEVHVVHTYRGDLVIDLVSPDGTTFRLKSRNVLDGADNVDATYTGNLSGEPANGTWRLRVQDVFGGDTGFINSWALTL
jgi:subtilisin family serine protease